MAEETVREETDEELVARAAKINATMEEIRAKFTGNLNCDVTIMLATLVAEHLCAGAIGNTAPMVGAMLTLDDFHIRLWEATEEIPGDKLKVAVQTGIREYHKRVAGMIMEEARRGPTPKERYN